MFSPFHLSSLLNASCTVIQFESSFLSNMLCIMSGLADCLSRCMGHSIGTYEEVSLNGQTRTLACWLMLKKAGGSRYDKYRYHINDCGSIT